MDPTRPHMFQKELQLYLDYLKEEISDLPMPQMREKKAWKNFCDNLTHGIAHYRELLNLDLISNGQSFATGLMLAEEEIAGIRQWLEKIIKI